MYNALKKTILGICGFGFLCTLILLVVFRGNMDVYRANVFSVSNAILLIPGLCLIALIVLINRKHGDMVEAFLKKNTVILLVITLVLLLAVRLIISYEGYFSPGWDAKVILDTTTSIVKGTEIANYDYYSRFPNNILIVWLFSGIGKIAALCGIDTIGYALLAFQSMVCTAGVLLVFLITKGLSNSIKTAWLAYAIAYIIVGLSPWFLVAYSDATGIIFPLLLIRIYQKIRKQQKTVSAVILGALLGMIAMASFFIKPQLFIAFISVILIELISLFKKDSKEYRAFTGRFTGCAVRLGSFLLGIVLFLAVYKCLIVPSLNIEIDPEMSVSVKHYIMMGLNDSTDGIYCDDDYKYSCSFDTYEERGKANMEVALQRLKNYSAAGLFRHMAEKHIENYGDGTFAWGVEGEFYEAWSIQSESGIGKLIRFTISGDGIKYDLFTNTFQMLWLTMMLLIIFIPCTNRIKAKGANTPAIRPADESVLLILVLSIIGLTIFELLFEARARYLFCYAPYYIIMASMGCRELCAFYKGFRNTGS